MLTNQELRDVERAKRVNALFAQRHQAPGHDRYYTRPAAGRWERIECAFCDVVVNFLETDLPR